MAYTFAKSPNHSYLRTTAETPVQWGQGVDGTGFSVSLWFNATDATGAHTLLRLEHGVPENNTRYLLVADGATYGDPVRWISQIGGSTTYTAEQGSYTANAWQHVFASAGFGKKYTALYVAINGALICAEKTDAIAPTDAESYVQIGGDNFFIQAIDGAIAEVAIYDINMNELGMEQARFELARGFAPSRVMPQHLIFYAPLVRGLQDVVSANSLSAYNTPTVSAHPPIKA